MQLQKKLKNYKIDINVYIKYKNKYQNNLTSKKLNIDRQSQITL